MKKINEFWVPDDDYNLVLDLLGPGSEHDQQVFDKIRELIKDQPKRHFVDVGGNIGRWSKEFVNDYGRITAFEPAPYNIECFLKNTEHDTTITLRQYGLGEKQGMAKLKVNVPNHLGSTIASPDPAGDVKIERLDDQGGAFEDIDLLKIDVEGFETEVLKGGKEMINMSNPLIAVERHAFNYKLLGKTKKESHLYLENLGYKLIFKLTRDCIYGKPNIHYRT